MLLNSNMLLNSKAEQKSAGVRLSGAPDRGVRRIARRSHFSPFQVVLPPLIPGERKSA